MNDGDLNIDGLDVLAGSELYLSTVSVDPVDAVVQDVNRTFADGRMFGRDFRPGNTLNLGISVRRNEYRDNAGALELLGELAATWNAVSTRTVPGAESVVRFQVGGRARRAYGRTRVLNPNLAYVGFSGLVQTQCQFETSDPYFYDDTEQSVTVGLTNPTSTGAIWPLSWPVSWGGVGERQGVVSNTGGTIPAPFTVTINGPGAGPRVHGKGWTISLPDVTLAYDESVTIDTRAGTVTRSDGASLGGKLSRKTFLDECRLVAGKPDEFTFSITDPTHTATATLAWRPAYASI